MGINGFRSCLNSRFQKRVEAYCKKHKQILKDLSKLIDELVEDTKIGVDLGQNVYKIRLAISGTSKGKSAGARVITYVFFDGKTIYLSEIYLKNEYNTVDVKSVIERLHDEGFI